MAFFQLYVFLITFLPFFLTLLCLFITQLSVLSDYVLILTLIVSEVLWLCPVLLPFSIFWVDLLILCRIICLCSSFVLMLNLAFQASMIWLVRFLASILLTKLPAVYQMTEDHYPMVSSKKAPKHLEFSLE